MTYHPPFAIECWLGSIWGLFSSFSQVKWSSSSFLSFSFFRLFRLFCLFRLFRQFCLVRLFRLCLFAFWCQIGIDQRKVHSVTYCHQREDLTLRGVIKLTHYDQIVIILTHCNQIIINLTHCDQVSRWPMGGHKNYHVLRCFEVLR